MARQTVLPPLRYGMGLTRLKVLGRRAETWAQKRNCWSASGVDVIDAVPGTNFVFHPPLPGRARLWMSEELKLLYWIVGFE